MCFLKEGKTDQAVRCIKSRIIIKVIYYVLSIDTFEPKCVVLKGMLQSLRLKYHVQNISIYQYKIIQQLMDKLFLLVNQLSRHNIYSLCKKTSIGIGNSIYTKKCLVFDTGE